MWIVECLSLRCAKRFELLVVMTNNNKEQNHERSRYCEHSVYIYKYQNSEKCTLYPLDESINTFQSFRVKIFIACYHWMHSVRRGLQHSSPPIVQHFVPFRLTRDQCQLSTVLRSSPSQTWLLLLDRFDELCAALPAQILTQRWMRWKQWLIQCQGQVSLLSHQWTRSIHKNQDLEYQQSSERANKSGRRIWRRK